METQKKGRHAAKRLSEVIKNIRLQRLMQRLKIGETEVTIIGISEPPDLFDRHLGKATGFESFVKPAHQKAEWIELRIIVRVSRQNRIDLLTSMWAEGPDQFGRRSNNAVTSGNGPMHAIQQLVSFRGPQITCREERAQFIFGESSENPSFRL